MAPTVTHFRSIRGQDDLMEVVGACARRPTPLPQPPRLPRRDYVVASFEDTSGREVTRCDVFGYEGRRYVNPRPRIILEIADWSERISRGLLAFVKPSDGVENRLCRRLLEAL
jgi:hypothetical protein